MAKKFNKANAYAELMPEIGGFFENWFSAKCKEYGIEDAELTPNQFWEMNDALDQVSEIAVKILDSMVNEQ